MINGDNVNRNNFNVEVNNLTKFDIGLHLLENVAKETLKKSSLKCLASKNISISVAIVSEKEIQGINNLYRKKNKATDVLSFSEYANIYDLCNNKEKEIFLGEIIICPEYIEKSSREQNVSFDFELTYIFSHGILHLLDFSHGKEMFSMQEEIAEKYLNKK